MSELALGESATRIFIWIAVAAWAVVMAGWLAGRRLPAARWIWAAGWVAYVAHVAAAFSAYHGWSHAHASAVTAEQTEAVTGWSSGIGLWFNYGFGLWWLADVIRWHRTGLPWIEGKGHWRTVALHGFMAFMIFNGTVVFGQGAVRWFGIAIFVVLAAIGLRAKMHQASPH